MIFYGTEPKIARFTPHTSFKLEDVTTEIRNLKT